MLASSIGNPNFCRSWVRLTPLVTELGVTGKWVRGGGERVMGQPEKVWRVKVRRRKESVGPRRKVVRVRVRVEGVIGAGDLIRRGGDVDRGADGGDGGGLSPEIAAAAAAGGAAADGGAG
ncbi:hypothetical protein E2542_SST13665 [Spatholobus suberectus]|nr:hypothetical protein E2542_SST13665 [Spatholobus suberectus]